MRSRRGAVFAVVVLGAAAFAAVEVTRSVAQARSSNPPPGVRIVTAASLPTAPAPVAPNVRRLTAISAARGPQILFRERDPRRDVRQDRARLALRSERHARRVEPPLRPRPLRGRSRALPDRDERIQQQVRREDLRLEVTRTPPGRDLGAAEPRARLAGRAPRSIDGLRERRLVRAREVLDPDGHHRHAGAGARSRTSRSSR